MGIGLDRTERLRRHPAARAAALLAPPLGFFGFFYLAALAVLFISAFWTVDSFTGELVHTWTTINYQTLWDDPVYRHVAQRTIVIAALVTIADAVIAFEGRRLGGSIFTSFDQEAIELVAAAGGKAQLLS